MAKLFALEEMDETGAEVELEASPEVGEVSDVQVDMTEDMSGVDDQSEAITEGVEAADQLGEVEDVVASAAEAEGLDPVAAEAIRIAVEAICSRIGANPKAIYSLYATENFQSASSRKANSKIALEGVGEFLKDLWKKIKSALANLWTKVKAFWEKHLSSLGRIKKALESMKQKVAQSSGKIQDKAYVEVAPSALVDAFSAKTDLTADAVSKTIAAHVAAGKSVSAVANSGAAAGAAGLVAVKGSVAIALGKVTGTWKLGTATAPMVGGAYIKYEVKEEDGELVVDVDRQSVDKEGKAVLNIADKAKLAAVIKETLDLINEDVKNKAAFDKQEAEFTKTMVDIEKAINATVTDSASAEAAKEVRKSLKVVYKANAKVPTIGAEKIALDVKLAKAVLGFTSFCVKQYK